MDLTSTNHNFMLVKGRASGFFYKVEHGPKDTLYIVATDRDYRWSRLYKSSFSSPGDWHTVIEFSGKRTFITKAIPFAHFTILKGRHVGRSAFWLLPQHNPYFARRLNVGTDDGVIELIDDHSFLSTTCRYSFQSMKTPRIEFEEHIASGGPVLKSKVASEYYNSDDFFTTTLHAKSKYGTLIPVTIVLQMRMGGNILKCTRNALLLQVYGSYGLPTEPLFDHLNLPLLHRGVSVAIAHVRGGGEFGPPWHHAARLDGMRRTIEDFLAWAEMLIRDGWVEKGGLAIEGTSAGGTIVAAAINTCPDLFCAAIAQLPFVDVFSSLSDPSVPLSTTTWNEFGNPNTKNYHESVRDICPYANVGSKPYPPILVFASKNDSRVPCGRVAKWVAMIRKFSTSGNNVMFQVRYKGGHSLADGPDDAFHVKS